MLTNTSDLTEAFFIGSKIVYCLFFAMETTQTNRKEIIILLLADMRNSRLILGLRSVGLNTDNFYTNLTDLILQKMGFDNYADKTICAWYEDTLHTLIDKELHYYVFHERELAEHMYDLMELKKYSVQEIASEPHRMVWGGWLKKWIMGKE